MNGPNEGGPGVEFVSWPGAFSIVGICLFSLAEFIERTIELRSAAKALRHWGGDSPGRCYFGRMCTRF